MAYVYQNIINFSSFITINYIKSWISCIDITFAVVAILAISTIDIMSFIKHNFYKI
jgi:hypothetical protein